MAGSNQYKVDEFIQAIPGTGGIISTIAKKIGCDWHTAKKYIEQYPTVKRVYDAECEGNLDLAEEKLIEAIREKDLGAIKFFLTTKGRERGYVLKQELEHSGPGGGPVVIKEVIVELPEGGG